MSKLSPARIRANNKWKRKNKKKVQLYHYRSFTKRFINHLATKEDLYKVIRMAERKLRE